MAASASTTASQETRGRRLPIRAQVPNRIAALTPIARAAPGTTLSARPSSQGNMAGFQVSRTRKWPSCNDRIESTDMWPGAFSRHSSISPPSSTRR